ncbi:hypothetical protein ACL02S_15245 [Nocardia sp. 004]|uniref:hypothetical protein n=1 Tax=Nocardia sp. 004 TaxID=3385978 RepID=UPI0039A301EE
MADLVVIGAGKFAVEVSAYLDDARAAGAGGPRIATYLTIADEEVHVPSQRCVPLDGFTFSEDTEVIVAVSDIALRRKLFRDVVEKYGLRAANVIHPGSTYASARIEGTGNIIGPSCYLGADVVIGDCNVLNYHCTIGHHSRIGSNNFFAPNFHCGNSVEIGHDNFFGLSCTIVPEIRVGDHGSFQAGLTLFDNPESHHSYFVPTRMKSLKLP